MADDMTEAEAAMANLKGVENHPYGVVLVRAVRLLRAARTKFAATDARIAATDDRVDATDARVAALEDRVHALDGITP